MTNLYILIAIVASILAGLIFLFIRYIRIKLGLKDSNYGAVQHIRKLLPPPSAEDLFLPGSHMEEDGQEMLKRHIEETPQIEQLSKKKKKKRLFTSKEDILRAYIADTVLDKPKWNEKPNSHSKD